MRGSLKILCWLAKLEVHRSWSSFCYFSWSRIFFPSSHSVFWFLLRFLFQILILILLQMSNGGKVCTKKWRERNAPAINAHSTICWTAQLPSADQIIVSIKSLSSFPFLFSYADAKCNAIMMIKNDDDDGLPASFSLSLIVCRRDGHSMWIRIGFLPA